MRVRNHLNISDNDDVTTQSSLSETIGFSNFGHFKAPIKRPSCNPMIKDERFKRINDIDEACMRKEQLSHNQMLCNMQSSICQ
jgi:hypothetical protein